MRQFVVLLFFTSVTISFSQSKIDSLIRVIQTTTSEKIKAETFTKLGKEYGEVHLDQAMMYFDKAIAIATKNNLSQILADAYNGKAVIYIKQGKNQSAIENLNKAVACYKKRNNKQGIASVYGNLGSLYFTIGNYKKSLELQLKCLKLEEEIKDKLGQAIALEGIGGVYYVLNDFTKTLLWYIKALQLYQSIHKYDEASTVLLNIGLTYESMKDFKKGIEYTNQSIELATKINNKDVVANGYMNLGMLSEDVTNYNQALLYHKKAVTLLNEIGNEYRSTDALSYIAHIYFLQKEYQKSIDFYQQFLAKAKQMKMPQYERTALEGLSDCYAQLKNYEKAYSYHKQFSILQDTLLNKEKSKQLVEMQTKFETEKKESENKLLKQQNQIQTLQISKSRYYIIGVSIFSLFIIIIGLLIVRQNKLNTLQRTTQLEQQLLRSQMNPHFIFNSLIAIQSFIYKKDPKEAGRYLSDFAQLMRMILENSRMEYISLDKEIKTLKHYLELQKLRFEDHFTYNIIVSEQIDIDAIAIPPMLAQPFIENAIEHGIKNLNNPGKITIQLTKLNNNIAFEITDNGIGIAKAMELNSEKQKFQSFAITITDERLQLLNKGKVNKIKLAIEELKDNSNQILGTQVVFTVPIKEM